MMTDQAMQGDSDDGTVEKIRSELAKTRKSKSRRVTKKFILAAVGAIPWVGAVITSLATLPDDEAKEKGDDLRTQWLEEHHLKLGDLRNTLNHIHERFDNLGETIEERIQSPEYLSLVRQAFRAWDQAETAEKRRYIANLLVNSAGTRVCTDDVVRLFISLIDTYHEAHFAVIREIHQNPGSSRYDIWTGVYGNELPQENSAEADLYKLLIRDLSTGGIIRQERDVTATGQFVRKRAVNRRRSAPTTLESAFEDTKQYVLTEMGKQFVHYTMNEAVTRLNDHNEGSSQDT